MIPEEAAQDFPGAAALAALRAWYAGMGITDAVAQYLPHSTDAGRSSPTVLGEIRRQLADRARRCRRDDLAQLILQPASERPKRVRAVMAAIDLLRGLSVPRPLVTDAVERWLPARIANPIQADGLRTLADLTVRVPSLRPTAWARGGRSSHAVWPARWVFPATWRARSLVSRLRIGPPSIASR
ncbi:MULTISPECIES: phage integrase family protein [Burkholderiales]|jgi:hypothetical protein|nr:phage integrase family protein [Delftia tsuruhatensis]MCO5340743.1 integrase [Delftia tsuruhatensis]MCR4548168.1 integrase [Delftia tsuruhatensis]HBO1858576.1 hypothetical protein [Pseudomonas aeruginosa]